MISCSQSLKSRHDAGNRHTAQDDGHGDVQDVDAFILIPDETFVVHEIERFTILVLKIVRLCVR